MQRRRLDRIQEAVRQGTGIFGHKVQDLTRLNTFFTGIRAS
jgi:hypothetical protein